MLASMNRSLVTMFSLTVTVATCFLFMHVTVQANSNQKQCSKKSTSLSYNIVSEYNATGHLIAKVTGHHRISPTPRTPEILCPWGFDVGHQVKECGETPAVRIAANIQVASEVPHYDEWTADGDDRDQVTKAPSYDVYLVEGGSAYKMFLKQHRKWHDAQSLCREDDANLLVINSQEEADLVVRILKNYTNIGSFGKWDKEIWVGLHEGNDEGDFVSVHNQSLSEVGYSVWAPGEPNNEKKVHEGGEDCVAVLRNGKLNDEVCTHKLAFICERSV